MDFIEGGCTEQFVVVGEVPFVVGWIITQVIEILVVGAARISALHVIDDPVPANKCAVDHLVAENGQAVPKVRVGLGDPQVINSKAAPGITVAEHHHALSLGRVVVDQGRETRRHPAPVGRRNEERDYRTAVLAWNGGAENAVARDPIATTSVVEHGQGLGVGAAVIAIVQGDALDTIGVMNPRGYEHVLVLRGQ